METDLELHDLAAAADEAAALFARVVRTRTGLLANVEGGDVAANGSRRSLLRHTAHYLAAAELARRLPAGRYVDVGGGVGALTVWLGRRLGLAPELVDADPTVRATAAAAFPEAIVHTDAGVLPAGSAALVTAMEVLEHLPPGEHTRFVAALVRLLAPGGLLVVSTPDESRYLGGWSGYAPHVGLLDADGLTTLLRAATGRRPTVWRLEGDPYRLGALERIGLPLANRTWGALAARAPTLAARLASAGASAGGALPRRPTAGDAGPTPLVRGVPPALGSGTGLLAAVRAQSGPAAGSPPPPDRPSRS